MEILTMPTFLAGLLIGLITGVAAYHFFAPSRRKTEALEQRLQSLTQENEVQQARVDNHFDKTAELVNKLTDSYKEVHQHLASGAQTLCTQDSNRLQQAPLTSLDYEKHDTEEPLQPPMDYAPRDTNETGTLSEEFGVDKVLIEETSESDTPSQEEATNNTDEDDTAPPRDYAERTTNTQRTLSEEFGIKPNQAAL